jgi:hypothetical protein
MNTDYTDGSWELVRRLFSYNPQILKFTFTFSFFESRLESRSHELKLIWSITYSGSGFPAAIKIAQIHLKHPTYNTSTDNHENH